MRLPLLLALPMAYPLVYTWGNNPVRAALKGRRCRIVVKSRRMGSALIEFDNGFRVVTSWRAVRRMK